MSKPTELDEPYKTILASQQEYNVALLDRLDMQNATLLRIADALERGHGPKWWSDEIPPWQGLNNEQLAAPLAKAGMIVPPESCCATCGFVPSSFIHDPKYGGHTFVECGDEQMIADAMREPGLQEIKNWANSYRAFKCVPENAEVFERHLEQAAQYVKTLIQMVEGGNAK